jgi:hypothetical protein
MDSPRQLTTLDLIGLEDLVAKIGAAVTYRLLDKYRLSPLYDTILEPCSESDRITTGDKLMVEKIGKGEVIGIVGEGPLYAAVGLIWESKEVKWF